MPIYEYRCEKCGEKFEVMRGITSGAENVKCPRCGDSKPTRLFSAVCGGGRGSDKGNLYIPT